MPACLGSYALPSLSCASDLRCCGPPPTSQGITWTHDGKGFFYCRFEEPETADKGTETTKNLGGRGRGELRRVPGNGMQFGGDNQGSACCAALPTASTCCHSYPHRPVCLAPLCCAGQQLMYHVLGTPQSKDVTVLADPDHPTWMFGTEVGGSWRMRYTRNLAGCALLGVRAANRAVRCYGACLVRQWC